MDPRQSFIPEDNSRLIEWILLRGYFCHRDFTKYQHIIDVEIKAFKEANPWRNEILGNAGGTIHIDDNKNFRTEENFLQEFTWRSGKELSEKHSYYTIRDLCIFYIDMLDEVYTRHISENQDTIDTLLLMELVGVYLSSQFNFKFTIDFIPKIPIESQPMNERDRVINGFDG